MKGWLWDFEKLSSLLAGAYAAVALIGASILILKPKTNDLAIKLLGSLMVLSIMFGANNAWIYAVGVFIVATLVTELQFLEKLAALAWNRKEYWKYLIRASEEEIEAKRQQEVEEIEESTEEQDKVVDVSEASEDDRSDSPSQSDPAEKRRQLYKAALAFERTALHVLGAEKNRIFGASRMKQQVKLAGASHVPMLDAVITSRRRHFIVEIKYYRHGRNIRNAFNQVEGFAYAYEQYVSDRGIEVDVCPVLIFPDSLNLENISLPKKIVALSFDQRNQEFTNVDEFKRSINRNSEDDT